MQTVRKQVLGVDVAQKELVVTLGRMTDDLILELYHHHVFSNKEKTFPVIIKWLKKHTQSTVNVQVVMEDTGVYHQKFAYYLKENGCDVSIVLPNQISNYMRTLTNKTINDKTCSAAIAQFGLERKLDNWEKPNALYHTLQQLTRERDQIVSERSIVKNQLHAEKSEAVPNANSLKRLDARIKFLNKQENDIKSDITICINQDQKVKKQVENICTIPGIGQLTAAIVLAETNGFELIRNKKQLTSYAGLDITEKTSGTSVKGKSRISKKGNRNLRKAMHLPALSAVKHIEIYKDTYARLVSKSGVKMKGYVAIQRKMLELIYTIHKNNSVFEQDYEVKKRVLSQSTDTLTS